MSTEAELEDLFRDQVAAAEESAKNTLYHLASISDSRRQILEWLDENKWKSDSGALTRHTQLAVALALEEAAKVCCANKESECEDYAQRAYEVAESEIRALRPDATKLLAEHDYKIAEEAAKSACEGRYESETFSSAEALAEDRERVRLEEANVWLPYYRSAFVWHQIDDDAKADELRDWGVKRIAELDSALAQRDGGKE